MTKSELIEYLPKNKQDTSNIAVLSKIGFPTLNCILPELLFWMTDYNWPIAKEICLILKKANKEIIPEIENIINEKDDERIWFLINNVLPELDLNIQVKLIKCLRKYKDSIQDPDYKTNAIKYIQKLQKEIKINKKSINKKMFYLYERIYLLLLKYKIRKILKRTILINSNSNIANIRQIHAYQNCAYKVLEEKIYNNIPNNEYITTRIRTLFDNEVDHRINKIRRDF